jgi:hypothetical protein
MHRYLDDGSADAPKLRVYLNWDNPADLRPDTVWPGLEGNDRMARLRADAFDGVQVTSGEPPFPSVMPCCGRDRSNTPSEVLPIATQHADRGDQCLTPPRRPGHRGRCRCLPFGGIHPECIGFMHGRIASPGQGQRPVDDATTRPVAASGVTHYFADLRTMWTHVKGERLTLPVTKESADKPSMKTSDRRQIGRASCRERVCQYV